MPLLQIGLLLVIALFQRRNDAAINESNRLIGVGAIEHNEEGQVLASSVQSFTAGFSPPVAEATGILRGLRFAIDFGLLPTVLESDGQWVVDLINSNQTAYAVIGVIICHIVSLSRQFDISISYVPIGAILSKLAMNSVGDLFWMESYPPSLEHFILEDCLPLVNKIFSLSKK
ncbi:hypothetical protein Ddye_031386 [Dipteronia dyeriana]|uniref:RNase H type-1 domain-containing protein n=1 Tax=Dipteronia dyeriana TaxID=168575 RepID=A0AAD9TI78_9ROSI|nr:hypothetical protein Ddye_031386 [Dipteronia dyeriana]